MNEIKISGLNDKAIGSIKQSPDFYRYQVGQCHRNSLELYEGKIMDNLYDQIGYKIIDRSIVEGFAVINGIVFPHIWNSFSIKSDTDVQKEYYDITKILFFNDMFVRYFETSNYSSDILKENNTNGSVFSDVTKEMAKQYASNNNLEYRE